MGFLKKYMSAIISFIIIEVILMSFALYVTVVINHTIGAVLELISLLMLIPFIAFIYQSEKKINILEKTLDTVIKEHNNELDIIARSINFSEDVLSIEALSSLANTKIHENFVRLISEFSKRTKENSLINSIMAATSSNMEIEKFLDVVMPNIMNLTSSNWIAFYLVNKTINKLEIKSSIGFSQKIYKQFDITIGEGFIGAAILDGKIKIIDNLPGMDNPIYLSHTILGKMQPKSLLLVPIINEKNEPEGIVALGSIYGYTEEHIKLMERVTHCLNIAIYNNSFYKMSERLLKEIKFQNQLIQELNAEQELKIAERTKFLVNMCDSLGDLSLLAVDNNYNITFVNNSASDFLKLPKDNLLGKNIQTIASNPFMLSKIKKCVNFTMNSGESEESLEFVNKDSVPIPVNTKMYSICSSDSQIMGVLLLFQNNKSAKAATQKPSETRGLIITNEIGLIESANKITESILGRPSTGIIGKNISELFEDEQAVKNFVKELAADNKHLDISAALKGSLKMVTLNANTLSPGKNTKKLFIYLK